MADIIRGPAHRSRIAATGIRRHTLTQCCLLSAGCPWYDSDAEVAAWWREARQKPLPDIATENRRLNQLAKMAAKGLEPIT